MDSPVVETCSLAISTSSDLGETTNYLLWEFGPFSPFEIYCLSSCFIAYLAATCWLICDYVDTIHDEVAYVWKQSLCLGSFLFFSLRYVGVISLLASFVVAMQPQRVFFAYACLDPSQFDSQWHPTKADIEIVIDFYRSTSPGEVSNKSYLLAPALQFPVFWLVEVAMQMRIFALYNSRILAAFNGALFVVEMSVMAYLWRDTGRAQVQFGGATPEYGVDGPWPSLGQFSELSESTFTAAWPMYWTPAIAFELWLAALAVAKLRRKLMKRELVHVLLRDSLLYFLMIAAFLILHAVLGSHNLGAYAVPFVIVGETVGGSRLILHLRKAYYGRPELATTATHPNISFAMPAQISALRSRRVVDESFYDSDD